MQMVLAEGKPTQQPRTRYDPSVVEQQRRTLREVQLLVQKQRPLNCGRREWRSIRSREKKLKRGIARRLEHDALYFTNQARTDDLYSFFVRQTGTDSQESNSYWKDGFDDASQDLELRQATRTEFETMVGDEEHQAYATTRINYTSALQGNERSLWMGAIERERMASEAKSVYQELPWSALPAGQKALPLVCLLELKGGGLGEVRRKARFVVRGDLQNPDQVPDDLFAPVTSQISMRLQLQHLISFSERNGLARQIAGGDVSEAFLFSDLREDVYVAPPRGVSREGFPLWKLKKGVYGLRQAPLMWYSLISAALAEMGWVQSSHDSCLFTRTLNPVGSENNPKDLEAQVEQTLILYVDDFQITSLAKRSSTKGQNLAEVARDEILAKFPGRKTNFVTEKSKTRWTFLGLSLCWDRNSNCIEIKAEDVITKTLSKHADLVKGYASSPLLDVIPIDSGPEVEGFTQAKLRAVCGSLNFIATAARPDLSVVTQQLATHMAEAKPGQAVQAAASRALTYLKNSRGEALKIWSVKGDMSHSLVGYTDADLRSPRSTTGNLLVCGRSTLLWRSQRQRLSALSSCESELISLCSCVKELKIVSFLIQDITRGATPRISVLAKDVDPYTVWCDNQSTIHVARSTHPTARTKHLELRGNYVSDAIKSGFIDLRFVVSQENRADPLTKPLPGKQLKHLLG